MKISTSNNCNQNYKINSTFRGHLGGECCCKNCLGALIHETAFFREQESDEFIGNLVRDKLKHQKSVKIISAGCSTGEEAITLSMLLDDVKDKVKIIGIDLSEDSIKMAKSRKFLFERPPLQYNIEDDCIAAYKDAYLVFQDEKHNLTQKDIENMYLFNKFFETYDYIKTLGFWKKIKKIIGNTIINNISYSRQLVKLRDGMATNCSFYQDNVLNIDKFTEKQKADIVLFRNILYHFITITDEDAQYRYLISNYKNIIENLITNLKKGMTADGIICFGKNEYPQHKIEPIVISSIMKKLNFKPLNATHDKPANIWQICNNK